MVSGKRFDNVQDEKKLVQWENILADTYLTKVEAREADSVDGRVKVMMHRSVEKFCDHVCVCVCMVCMWERVPAVTCVCAHVGGE